MLKFSSRLPSLTSSMLMLCALFFLAPTMITGKLSAKQIQDVARLDDQSHFQRALKSIMVPRVVGSDGWKRVQSYLANELESMGLQIELDSFVDNTPIFGRLNFVNVIGRLNPSADKFLVLSAHYDSKYFRNQEFLGATDSAVPCAMILNLLKTTLPFIKPMLEGRNVGLMVIFFDGEEAFKEWGPTDSIYGSRHLAQKWSQQSYKNGKEIQRISVLILLDLIGAGTPRFTCTFENTCSMNERLSQIETEVNKNFKSSNSRMFQTRFAPSGVDDDHRPFLERGVPVLHLIPTRFPRVWHTLNDDGRNLDFPSIEKFNRIMRVFIADYFVDCLSDRPTFDCFFE